MNMKSTHRQHIVATEDTAIKTMSKVLSSMVLSEGGEGDGGGSGETSEESGGGEGGGGSGCKFETPSLEHFPMDTS